jgi:hypothetical protein
VVEEQPIDELSETDRETAGPTESLPTAPPPPRTGDQGVDAAVAPLADVSLAPLEDHPAVYEGVHRALTDRLADVEG